MESQLSRPPPASTRRLSLPRGGDERLARLAGEGSSRAFAALYEKYHQQLYRYCRSIVRNDADAQDALQSTLAKALAALQRGQRDAPLRPWLFRIAHNEAITLLRRRPPTVELLDSHAPIADSTEELVQTRARLGQLVRDLQLLPERGRGALVMRELSGLSHEEIAIALQTTPGAAKQAVFEARQALAEYAEGRAMECEQARRAISAGDRRMLRGRRLRAHLRSCDGCAAFAAAIPARKAELQMLAPPIAPVAAVELLAHLTPAGTAHGGALGLGAASAQGPAGGLGAVAAQGPAGGLGAIASTAAGKTIGGALTAKTLVGAAVVAAVAVGASTVVPRITHDSSRAKRAAHGAGHHATPPRDAATTHRTAGGGGSSRGARGGATAKRPAGAASHGGRTVATPSHGRAPAHERGASSNALPQRGSAHSHARRVARKPASATNGSDIHGRRSGEHASRHVNGATPGASGQSHAAGGSPTTPDATPTVPAPQTQSATSPGRSHAIESPRR